MKFEQTFYNYDQYSGKKLDVVETITMETGAQSLSEIVDTFERFLKASGFVLNGKLDIVPEDELFGGTKNV